MSDQIAKVYSNFLEYEKRKNKKSKANSTAAMDSRGFMAPKSRMKNSRSGSSQHSEIDYVSQLVNEIRKAREVQ